MSFDDLYSFCHVMKKWEDKTFNVTNFHLVCYALIGPLVPELVASTTAGNSKLKEKLELNMEIKIRN